MSHCHSGNHSPARRTMPTTTITSTPTIRRAISMAIPKEKESFSFWTLPSPFDFKNCAQTPQKFGTFPIPDCSAHRQPTPSKISKQKSENSYDVALRDSIGDSTPTLLSFLMSRQDNACVTLHKVISRHHHVVATIKAVILGKLDFVLLFYAFKQIAPSSGVRRHWCFARVFHSRNSFRTSECLFFVAHTAPEPTFRICLRFQQQP